MRYDNDEEYREEVDKICCRNLDKMYTMRTEFLSELKSNNYNQLSKDKLKQGVSKMETLIDLCWKCTTRSHAKNVLCQFQLFTEQKLD